MFMSFQRSLDWHTEKQLFESGELVCPLNAKVFDTLLQGMMM